MSDPIDQYLALHNSLARLLQQTREAMDNGDIGSARHLLKRAQLEHQVMQQFESRHRPADPRRSEWLTH